MQQTEKYKFNLIETSDAFSPEALNQNAQKLEDALITHEASVDSALKSQELEWQAADNTVRAEFAAADSALSQTIAAVEKGASLFHLAGPVNNASTKKTFTIDLSGIDMSEYRALLLFALTGEGAAITCGSLSIKPYSTSTMPSLPSVIWICYMLSGIRIHCSTAYSGNIHGQSSSAIGSTEWTAIDHLKCSDKVFFIDVYGIKA